MRRLAATFAALCGLAACAHVDSRPFVWVESAPAPAPAGPGYVIGPGDVLSVRVWNQDPMSTKARVRSDGRFSMPFLNDVAAGGKTPATLAKDVEGALKDYVVNPRVTVVVEETRPLSVSVLGEVARPGLFNLEPGSGVAQALASAGGLGAFAHRDRIYVLRTVEGAPQRIRFRYRDLVGARPEASGFRLGPGDVVVVE